MGGEPTPYALGDRVRVVDEGMAAAYGVSGEIMVVVPVPSPFVAGPDGVHDTDGDLWLQRLGQTGGVPGVCVGEQHVARVVTPTDVRFSPGDRVRHVDLGTLATVVEVPAIFEPNGILDCDGYLWVVPDEIGTPVAVLPELVEIHAGTVPKEVDPFLSALFGDGA